MASPILLDLDAVETPVEVVVKLKGVEHKLAPVTVQGFVDNIKLIEQLGLSGNVTREIEIMREILLKAFPTMTGEIIGDLTLEQLRKLVEFAQDNNGQAKTQAEVVEKAKEEGAENPQ